MDKQQQPRPTSQITDTKSVSSNRNKTKSQNTDRGLRMLRCYFQVVGQVLPGLAGAHAYKLWLSTRRFPTPKRETKWQASARTYTLPSTFGPLMMYAWGEDKPEAAKIVLLHGWNGRATQMGAFVEMLVQAGFQVTAFDAPGHGLSPGNSTNILQIANALQSVVDSLGSVDAVIAHSFGAMALTFALRNGLTIRKAVCISPPADSPMLVEHFCNSLHLPKRTRKTLMARCDQNFGQDFWARISIIENAQHISTPVLIVHDENDREVPISHSKRLANVWPGAQLMVTQGLGHRRILYHSKVIQATKAFLIEKQPTVMSNNA